MAPSASAGSPRRLVLIIGGIALAVVSVIAVAVVAVVFLILPNGAERGPDGEIIAAGEVRLKELEPGDCINRPSDETVVPEVDAVPCAQPHDAEVFATFDLPEGTYPGEAEVARMATDRCEDALASRPELADSDYELVYYAPTIGQWYPPKNRRLVHERPVVCLLAHRGSPTTGHVGG